MNLQRIFEILSVFVPLSFLTVGGGQSVVTDIHRQAVSVHGWITEAQFLADYAISRMSPGPGSLLVALIGWQAGGFTGALAAAFGIFVPSSVLVFLLARVWARHRGANWVRAIEEGLQPVAAGMMLAASFTLLVAASGNWLSVLLAVLAACLSLATRFSPIVMVATGAAVFLIRSMV